MALTVEVLDQQEPGEYLKHTEIYDFVHFCRLLTRLGLISSMLIWCGNHTFRMLLLHNLVQLFVCGILGMEPFRMSTHSEVNDFRTFGVLTLEIAVTAGAIIVMEKIQKAKKKRTASGNYYQLPFTIYPYQRFCMPRHRATPLTSQHNCIKPYNPAIPGRTHCI